ncbi:hypothetical protein MMC10_010719 [Thelotrema lepadinum]|nr:hypothetical protein [Thelotrema lepadinum]
MSSYTSIDWPVFDPDDYVHLVEEGTLIPIIGTLKSRLHKRRLHSSAGEEYSHIPLPTPAASSAQDGDSPDSHFAVIPNYLISKETLEYIGYSDATANMIWERWANWGPDQGREVDGGPITFESLFRAHLHGQDVDAYTEDDAEWLTVMGQFGLSEELKACVMAPDCKEIRLSGSCKDWALDTVLARYEGLEGKQKDSASRGRLLRRAANRPETPPRRPQHASPLGNYAGHLFSRRTQTQSGPIPTIPRGSVTTSSPEVRADSPGHTVLYKGGHLAHFQKIFDKNGQVTKMPLLSTRLADFTSTKCGVHLTINYEVAQKFALWAHKRDPTQLAGILRIEIPNEALETLAPEEKLEAYWPSHDWKQLVWACRRGHTLRHALPEYALATLVIGNICSKTNRVIRSLDSPEDITREMVLKGSGGSDAIQYVFIDDEGMMLLEDYAGDKCTLHPMTGQEAAELDQGIVAMSALRAFAVLRSIAQSILWVFGL